MNDLYKIKLPLGGITPKKAIGIVAAYAFSGAGILLFWLSSIVSEPLVVSVKIGIISGIIIGIWTSWKIWSENEPDGKIETVKRSEVVATTKKLMPFVYIGIFGFIIFTKSWQYESVAFQAFLLWLGIIFLSTAVTSFRVYKFALRS